MPIGIRGLLIQVASMLMYLPPVGFQVHRFYNVNFRITFFYFTSYWNNQSQQQFTSYAPTYG